MAYQFRIPMKKLCPKCKAEIKKAKAEFRRVKHREYMQKYRTKGRKKTN